MSVKNRWPAVKHDFRPKGLSFRILKDASLQDLVEVCEHYQEQLNLYCQNDRGEYYNMVEEAI